MSCWYREVWCRLKKGAGGHVAVGTLVSMCVRVHKPSAIVGSMHGRSACRANIAIDVQRSNRSIVELSRTQG